MARERIYSKDVVDLGVLPGWKPKDPWEPIPVVEVASDEHEIQAVQVRPYLDITFNTGGRGEGVGLRTGAILEGTPVAESEAVEVDLSRVGQLTTWCDYSGCNRVIKETRRARNADFGVPE